MPRAGWQKLIENAGFRDVEIGEPADVFEGTEGEFNARRFATYGYTFRATKDHDVPSPWTAGQYAACKL